MILVFCGQKGGGGKSALSMHLAAEWQRRGRDVLLVDADPQGTTLGWYERALRRKLGVPPTLAVGDDLRRVVARHAPQHDLTIIDTAGHLAERLGAALAIADVAVIPVKPQTGDVDALGGSIRIVRDVIEQRARRGASPLHVRLAVCCADSTRVGRAAIAAFARTSVPRFETVLRYYPMYTEAQSFGRGVTLHAPSHRAAFQLAELASELDDFEDRHVA